MKEAILTIATLLTIIIVFFIMAHCSIVTSTSTAASCVANGNVWQPTTDVSHNGGYCVEKAK